ncbi:YqiA/YcfP family alpha/beta fold hydrolase [Glaciimonas sp. PAMC28666]|uniref:YqiA/YcfP family alpha/beta fold hydrolase n=1 Tax=Glaciimonas sp. PAMC28666 TaxID=2807626 RepID=UPI001966A623|nr:YqiA/YcfP family alpha/beta fold hydrolase [Glaciimonas sp. PAMC28666]QRX80983.1 alpha/beta fold hydrolase [Glaciimonas sp. PAMC28666]
MILYLHGFRSSPLSFKARLLDERLRAVGLEDTYACPQLPASPRAAVQLAQAIIAGRDPADVTVIGSSLGGFYATWLAELTGCRAVLLNPAIKPPRDLEKYVGMHSQYHSDAPFEFKREYIAELEALVTPKITLPLRYFLIAATGDEILDWHEMVDHYPLAQQTVITGSDHGISDFAHYADAVLAFCGVDVDPALAGH